MKQLVFSLVLMFWAFSSSYAVESSEPLSLEAKQIEEQKYPPVFYISNVEGIDFLEEIEAKNVFEKVDKKAIGLPIALRVLRSSRIKQDGSTVSTGLLAATTLGITPVVKTTEVSVRYDLLVNGKSIADFTYKVENQDVTMLFANNRNNEIGAEEREFLVGTIPQFLADLDTSEDAQELFKEYFYYFGE